MTSLDILELQMIGLWLRKFEGMRVHSVNFYRVYETQIQCELCSGLMNEGEWNAILDVSRLTNRSNRWQVRAHPPTAQDICANWSVARQFQEAVETAVTPKKGK